MISYKGDSRVSLLIEGYPRYGFNALSILRNMGWEALCITRLHPEYVIHKYNLENTRCLWLSTRKVKGAISPRSTSQLVRMVKASMKGKKNIIVFLDGVEFLLMWNDMNKIMSMIIDIEKILKNSDSEMLICIDPLTLEQRDIDCLCSSFPTYSATEVVKNMSTLIPQRTSSEVQATLHQTISDLLKSAELHAIP